MNKWDNRFLNLAKHISNWSRDPSTQVGAVIVDNKKRIISVGFNGLAQGVEDLDEVLNNRELKYPVILHAEENAILFSGRDLEGCTIYTWPFQPCAHCSSVVIQSGIKRVVAPIMPDELKERWKTNTELAEKQFRDSKVVLDLVEF